MINSVRQTAKMVYKLSALPPKEIKIIEELGK